MTPMDPCSNVLGPPFVLPGLGCKTEMSTSVRLTQIWVASPQVGDDEEAKPPSHAQVRNSMPIPRQPALAYDIGGCHSRRIVCTSPDDVNMLYSFIGLVTHHLLSIVMVVL